MCVYAKWYLYTFPFSFFKKVIADSTIKSRTVSTIHFRLDDYSIINIVAFWILLLFHCWPHDSNQNRKSIPPSAVDSLSHTEEVEMWFDLAALVFNRSAISNNGKHNNETNLSHLMHWAMRPAIKKEWTQTAAKSQCMSIVSVWVCVHVSHVERRKVTKWYRCSLLSL